MQTLTDKFNKLHELGFDIPDNQQIDSSRIEGCFKAKVAQRSKLDYDIDGLVISVDNIDDMLDMGMADKMKPKGQIALKFPAEASVVRIKKIHSSYEGGQFVGLVAEFDPIEMQGATLRRASLKSYRWITENDVGVGSVVEIIRSGDVIPKIEAVVSNLEADRSSIPEFCEICGEKLDTAQTFLVCPNEKCIAKEAARIRDFLKAVRVKGLSWKSWIAYAKEGITLYDILAKNYDALRSACNSSGQSQKILNKVISQIEC